MDYRQVPPIARSVSFEDLDELTLLACDIAGEARNQSREGKLGVAYVVHNRVEANIPKWFGEGYHGVLLKPQQFSCFNPTDPNYSKLLTPYKSFGATVWRECYAAAASVYFDLVPDPTDGADHYHTTRINPSWADAEKVVARIDDHIFYRLAG